MLVVRCLSRFAATAAFAMFLSLGGAPANALYDVKPGETRGRPGTIIRVWPLEAGDLLTATLSISSTALPGRRANRSRSRALSSSPPALHLPAAATSSLGRTRLQASCQIALLRCIRIGRD